MNIPVSNESDKVKSSFSLDGEDHPMVKGMKPGKIYHMKIKAKMTGSHTDGKKHHGTFEIHSAEDQTKDQSISQIFKDGAEEEASHEKKESKKKESKEDNG